MINEIYQKLTSDSPTLANAKMALLFSKCHSGSYSQTSASEERPMNPHNRLQADRGRNEASTVASITPSPLTEITDEMTPPRADEVPFGTGSGGPEAAAPDGPTAATAASLSDIVDGKSEATNYTAPPGIEDRTDRNFRPPRPGGRRTGIERGKRGTKPRSRRNRKRARGGRKF